MKTNRVIGTGFTLIELLVVIGIIGLLAALLFPALSLAKGRARSVACKNRLHQMGLALQTYVNDHEYKYPYYWTHVGDPSLEAAVGRENTGFWWAKLIPYYPVKWTNATYHCPGYKGAINGWERPACYGSYAYNGEGVASFHVVGSPDRHLGLSGIQNPPGHDFSTSGTTPEARIRVPSEMLAIGESRFLNAQVNGIPGGYDSLTCGYLKSSITWNIFDPARHGKDYNVTFCDGHIASMDPWVLFDPSKTAAMWNNDHQPHPESWFP